MSFFDSIGGILSNVVNIAVTAWTGNPMLGQLASGIVDSLLNESGGSGNAGFDKIFDNVFGNNFQAALGKS